MQSTKTYLVIFEVSHGVREVVAVVRAAVLLSITDHIVVVNWYIAR